MPEKYIQKIKDEKGNTYTIKDPNAFSPDSTQLQAINSGITSAKVGRMLLTPVSTITGQELVGVEAGGDQIRVRLGDGLTLTGDTSPYTINAAAEAVTIVHVARTITVQGETYTPDKGFVALHTDILAGKLILAEIQGTSSAVREYAIAMYVTGSDLMFVSSRDGETVWYNYNALSGFSKTETADITTVIGSLSTNDMLPTALAVKNYVDDLEEALSSSSYNAATETLTLVLGRQ